MALHRIRRGLDIPLAGAPAQVIHDGPEIARVALVGDDFPGFRARVRVEVGDVVRRGQLICEDARIPGVRHTAPGAGTVEAIHRGPRRVLESIVIALSEGERLGTPAPDELQPFGSYSAASSQDLGGPDVRDLLVESGLWTAFRTRPFSRTPSPDALPHAIFVTAIDTNPLAGEPEVIVAERSEDFRRGLHAVSKLSAGPTYLCVRRGSKIAEGIEAHVRVEEFEGPHPAGAAGVHIHLLHPVGRDRTVWTIGYPDVVAIGSLLETGTLDTTRVVALGGPPLANPRLLRTRLGASVAELTSSEDVGEETRWVCGSVLSGKAAVGEALSFLGRFDVQLSALREGGEREFLSWLRPGLGRFSALPAFLSRLGRGSSVELSTTAHGSPRAIIPIGLYERVMPMDILPTFLLRALAVGDIERAEELGCLELAEEDLALCSFVDPGKTDFGPLLRRSLELIEHAG